MMLIPLLIAQLILFGGLVLLLRYILVRHAMHATGRLETLTREAMEQQEALKKRLEESERQYQEQIAKAQEEAREIKADVLKEAQAAKEQAVSEARTEAERIVTQAKAAREALQNELTSSFEMKAVQRACEILQQVLPRVLKEQTHSQWIDDLLKNGSLPLEKVSSKEPLREARVVSAFPLTPSQRKVLLERLQGAVGNPLTLEEEVDPAIVAGLTITLGNLVLDGSLASKIREAARRAEDAAQ